MFDTRALLRLVDSEAWQVLAFQPKIGQSLGVLWAAWDVCGANAVLKNEAGYKGIAYALTELDNGRWKWAFYPKDGPPQQGEILGTREHGEIACMSAINAWLRAKSPRSAVSANREQTTGNGQHRYRSPTVEIVLRRLESPVRKERNDRHFNCDP